MAPPKCRDARTTPGLGRGQGLQSQGLCSADDQGRVLKSTRLNGRTDGPVAQSAMSVWQWRRSLATVLQSSDGRRTKIWSRKSYGVTDATSHLSVCSTDSSHSCTTHTALSDNLYVCMYVCILMVKTFQFTTKCKIDCWVIALKQQKSK